MGTRPYDWVEFNRTTGEILCIGCGEKRRTSLPLKVDPLILWVKLFIKAHERCGRDEEK